MNFKFYEISVESEGTGDGYLVVFTDTLKKMREIAKRLAGEEYDERKEEGEKHGEFQTKKNENSTITVQEHTIRGNPKMVAAACLACAAGANEGEWEGDKFQRANIWNNRRWRVLYSGKLIPVWDKNGKEIAS